MTCAPSRRAPSWFLNKFWGRAGFSDLHQTRRLGSRSSGSSSLGDLALDPPEAIDHFVEAPAVVVEDAANRPQLREHQIVGTMASAR